MGNQYFMASFEEKSESEPERVKAHLSEFDLL